MIDRSIIMKTVRAHTYTRGIIVVTVHSPAEHQSKLQTIVILILLPILIRYARLYIHL